MADNNTDKSGSKVWIPEYESKVEKDKMTIFTLLNDEKQLVPTMDDSETLFLTTVL